MPRVSNLVEREFGLLKVVERTEQREKGYCVWRCECKCGGIAFVNTKRLLRGTVTDCGCVLKHTAKRGTIAEDLTGRHFGEWEVLQRDENKRGRVMWSCRCSCGTIRTISAHDLKAGKTNSCRNPTHPNINRRRDLRGKTIGSLEILYSLNQRDYKGSVMWHCRCKLCNKEKDISADVLIHGNYKSCGCGRYAQGKELAKHLHHYKGTTVEALGMNRKPRSDNQLGVAGVSKRANNTYRATIGFQGKRYHLGTYETIAEAQSVYINAKQALHGKFIKAYTAWSKSDQKQELIFDIQYINETFLIKSNY